MYFKLKNVNLYTKGFFLPTSVCVLFQYNFFYLQPR